MKQVDRWSWALLIAGLVLLTLLGVWQARGELSATVERGYEFESGERLTVDKLNALGLPTVTVVGTVTGSTLSTNSVDKTHVKTNVFDQVTITGGNNTSAAVNYDDWSIGVVSNKLAVLTNGISNVHLADDAVGIAELNDNWLTNYTAITAPALDDYALLADENASHAPKSVTLENLIEQGIGTAWLAAETPVTPADDDRLLVSDADDSDAAKAITVAALRTAIGSAPEWTTNDVPLYFGAAINAAHGLGRAPYSVRVTLVCTNQSVNGYEVGDELEALSLIYHATGEQQYPLLSTGANTTNVWVTLASATGEGWKTVNKTNGIGGVAITRTNWTLSVRAW